MNTEVPPNTPLYPPPISESLKPEERTWAAIAHASAFCSLIGIPGFVGPLVVWLIKKDQSPFVADQAKEAMNFHITMFIAFVVTIPFMFCGVGFLMAVVVVLLELICAVIGAVSASNGQMYRYPFTLRLIR